MKYLKYFESFLPPSDEHFSGKQADPDAYDMDLYDSFFIADFMAPALLDNWDKEQDYLDPAETAQLSRWIARQNLPDGYWELSDKETTTHCAITGKSAKCILCNYYYKV